MKNVKGDTKSRGENLLRIRGTLDFPEIEEEEYLIDYWQDIGLASPGAMGMIPISSSEIRAWQDMSGVWLSVWEYQTLREMSREYVAQYNASDQKDTPPPYIAKEYDKQAIEKKIKTVLRIPAGKKK